MARKQPQPILAPTRYYIVGNDGRMLLGTTYAPSFAEAKAMLLKWCEKGGHLGVRETIVRIRRESNVANNVATVMLRGDHDWDQTVANLHNTVEASLLPGFQPR